MGTKSPHFVSQEAGEVPQICGLFSKPVECALVFNDLPSGVIFLDSLKKVLYLNRAAEVLTGLTNDEARGLPCWHVVRSNICLGGCPLASPNLEGSSKYLEGNLINRDRCRVPIRISHVIMRDLWGNLAGFMEILEDVRVFQGLETLSVDNRRLSGIIGRSPAIERIFSILPGIAQTDSSVLITGETGTGKDLLAEAIHQMSSRAKGPFVKVNCGALPETLLESELFGHQKGAFTGAVENKPGRFRLAHNGTLFLTEVGDLPLSLQVKLLTFLDDHVIYPLGSTRGIRVDVRIIAATHRDLQAMVREGKFRQDLLYRLNVVRIHIPPLRERREDVRVLVEYFLAAFVSKFNKSVRGFSKEALRCLLEYPYPGNVRELKNIVEYAVNMCQEDTIQVYHLPSYITGGDKILEEPLEISGNGASVLEPKAPELPGDSKSWEELERGLIIDALMKAKGRKGKAAKILGWGRATLWRKMRHHRLLPFTHSPSISQGEAEGG